MEMSKRELAQLLTTENPVGMFAVFRRGRSGTGARFRALHNTYDSALSAAQEHSAEAISKGNMDFTYYVVEVKSKMGIEHGRLVHP